MGLQARTLPAERNGYEFPTLALQLRNLFGCVFPFPILDIAIFMYRHSPTIGIFPVAVYQATPALQAVNTVSKTSFSYELFRQALLRLVSKRCGLRILSATPVFDLRTYLNIAHEVTLTRSAATERPPRNF